MTVDDFAEALSKDNLELTEEGHYQNQYGETGYFARYKSAHRYYWFSVSRMSVRLAPDEISVAITNRGRTILREYPYSNTKGQQGFEATVRSGDHFFMLGAAPESSRR